MDVSQILLNIVAQFFLFVLNIFIIPFGVVWLSAHYGEGFPEFLRKIATFFQNKVVVPALNLVSTGILIITGNEIYPIETMEDLQEVAAERRRSWYIPWKQLGIYLALAIFPVVPIALSIPVLMLLLPKTFASLADGIAQWTALQSGEMNLDYLKRMFDVFVDLAWNRFALGALNENFLLLILFVIFITFIFPMVGLLSPDPYYATWPTMLVLISAFNFIFAIINYNTYLTVATVMNSVGMILLFAMIIHGAITLCITCFKIVLGKIIK